MFPGYQELNSYTPHRVSCKTLKYILLISPNTLTVRRHGEYEWQDPKSENEV